MTSLRNREGFTLAIVLFTVVLLASLAVTMTTITFATRQETDFDLTVDRAAYIARAGFERTCAERLLASNDWSTLVATPFVDEAFADGSFSATISDASTDSCTITVVATQDGRTRTLVFSLLRETGGAPPPAPTTGVRVFDLDDPTLAALTR